MSFLVLDLTQNFPMTKIIKYFYIEIEQFLLLNLTNRRV